MKHIKLFEAFGQMVQDPEQGPALIVATGDWTGITQTGEAVDFTVPAVVNVTYYPNPTPEQISQANKEFPPGYPLEETIFSPDDAAYEIMSGDQGGTNLYKDDQEGVTLLVDKSKGPEEIERVIQGIINVFNEGGDTGADQFTSVLENPDAKDIYTPEYLAHCRYCKEKDPIGLRYKYPLPAAIENGVGPKKLMKRQLNFKVV